MAVDTSSGDEESGLQVTGLRTLGGGASRFSGLFGSDDSSSSGEDVGFDEDDAGRDLSLGEEHEEPEDPTGYQSHARRGSKGRRPSTTEAKERTPLDDEEGDEDLGPELDAKLVLGGGRRGVFVEPEGAGGSSSEEEELVEIRPRRIS